MSDIFGTQPADTGGSASLEVGRRVHMLSNQLPELDPQSVYALASDLSMPTGNLIKAAAESIDQADIKRHAAELQSMDPMKQTAMWQSMSPDRQNLYSNLGQYVPPDVQARQRDTDRNWYSGVVGAVGGVLTGIKDGVLGVGGTAFDWMQNANDFTAQRVPRMVRDMQGEERLADVDNVLAAARSQVEAQLGVTMTESQYSSFKRTYMERNKHNFVVEQGLNPVASALGVAAPYAALQTATQGMHEGFNPYKGEEPVDTSGELYRKFEQAAYTLEASPDHTMSVTDSWGRTASGDQYIPPTVQLEARLAMGGQDSEGFRLALALSKGQTVSQFITDTYGVAEGQPGHDEKYREVLLKWIGTPEAPAENGEGFKKAKDIMSASQNHVSFGRDFAQGTLGINGDSTLHTWVSGVTDATAAMTLDPTLVAGKGLKSVKALRWAVDGNEFRDNLADVVRLAKYETLDGVKAVKFVEPIPPKVIHTAELTRFGDAIREPFEKAGLELRPLITKEGEATPYLVENFDEVTKALSVAHGEQAVLAEAGDQAAKGLAPRLDDLRRHLSENVDLVNHTSDKGLFDAVRVRDAKAMYAGAERIARAFRESAPELADDVRKTNAFDMLFRDLPQTQKGITELVAYDAILRSSLKRGIQTADDVFDFYNQPLGFGALSGGRLTKTAVSSNLVELPRITGASKVWRGSINGVGDAIEWAAGFGAKTADDVGRFHVPNPIAGTGKLLFGLTHHIPDSTILELAANPDVTGFKQLLDYGVFTGMKKEVRDAYLDKFVRGLAAPGQHVSHEIDEAGRAALSKFTEPGQPFEGKRLFYEDGMAHADLAEGLDALKAQAAGDDNLTRLLDTVKIRPDEGGQVISIAGRLEVTSGFIRNILQDIGAFSNPKFKDRAEEMVSHLNNHRYATGGLDIIQTGTEQRRAAVLAIEQWAGAREIPRFREIAANTKRLSYVQRTLGILNNDLVDAFMSKGWKPLTLLRAGFIPRTTGEEMFAFLARHGLPALEAKLAANAVSDLDSAVVKLGKGVVSLPFRHARNAPGEAMLYRSMREAEDWRQAMREGAEVWGFEPNRFDAASYWVNHHAARVTNVIKRMEFRAAGPQIQHGQLAMAKEFPVKHVENVRVATAADVAAGAVNKAGKPAKVGEKLKPEIVEVPRAYNLQTDPVGLAALYERAEKNRQAIKALSRYSKVQDSFARTTSAVHHNIADEVIPDAGTHMIRVAKDGRQAAESPMWVATVHSGKWEEIDRAAFQMGEDRPYELLGQLGHTYDQWSKDAIARFGLEPLAGAVPEAKALEMGRALSLTDQVDAIATQERAIKYADDLTAHDVARDAMVAEQATRAESYTSQIADLQRQRKKAMARARRNAAKTEADPPIPAAKGAQAKKLKADLIEDRKAYIAAKFPDSDPAALARGAERDYNAAFDAARRGRAQHGADPDTGDAIWVDWREKLTAEGWTPEQMDRLAQRAGTEQHRAGAGASDEVAELDAQIANLKAQADTPHGTGELPPHPGELPLDPVMRPWDAQDALDEVNKLGNRFHGWHKDERELLERFLRTAEWEAYGDLPVGNKLLGMSADDLLADRARAMEANGPRQLRLEQAMVILEDYPHMKAQLQSAIPGSVTEELLVHIGPARTKMADLEALMKIDPRYRLAVFGDAELKVVGNVDDLRGELVEQYYKALSDPQHVGEDLWQYTTDNARVVWNGSTGNPVARPPSNNETSFYPLMADQPTIDAIGAEYRADPRGFVARLHEAGLTDPADSKVVGRILGEWNTATQNGIDASLRATSSGTLRPINLFASTDYDQMRRLEAIFQKAAITDTGTVKVGYRRIQNANLEARLRPATSPIEDVPGLHRLMPEQAAWALPFTDTRIVKLNGHYVEGDSLEEAQRAWAGTLADTAMMQFVNEGEVMHEVMEPVRRGNFGLDVLEQIPLNRLPQKFLAPIMYHHSENWWSKVTQHGFTNYVGPATDSIVRRPMFAYHFSRGLEAAEPMRAMLQIPELYDKGMAVAKIAKFTDIEDIRDLWHLMPDWQRPDATPKQFFATISDAYGGTDKNPFAVLEPGVFDAVFDMAKHDEYVTRQITDTALGRAFRDTIPYIDDHNIRSFFQEHARNIMPFEFAQEQFLKRWANTMVHSPEAFQRAQLMVHGFTHSGIVHKDENGVDVFTFPMTESLNKLIGHRLSPISLIWGGSATIPTVVPLTGEVRSMFPGPADAANAPALGPIINVPFGQLLNHFPEFRKISEPITGQRGAGSSRGVVEQFVPTYLANAYKAITQDPDSDRTMHASMLGAMQQMEAEAIRFQSDADRMEREGDHEGAAEARLRAAELKPGETAPEQQAYISNLKRWARGNMMLRAAIGFWSPNQPHPEFAGAKLNPELQELLKHMPLEEAYGVFMAEHPEAQPYTVFASQTAVGRMPASEASLQWLRENEDVAATYPMATSFLMPANTTNEPYNSQAFHDQIEQGLRTMRSPEQWIADNAFNAAAGPYFHERDQFNAAMLEAKAAGDKDAVAQLRVRWKAFSVPFMEQHPLFKQELSKHGADPSKHQAIDELRLAVNDPSIVAEHKEQLREMIESLDNYTNAKASYAGDRRTKAVAASKRLDDDFMKWAEYYVGRHPEMQAVWRTLIAPVANLRDRQVAEELLAESK